jgi:hypothetical protein
MLVAQIRVCAEQAFSLASPSWCSANTYPPGDPSMRPRLGPWSYGVSLCPCKTGFGRVRGFSGRSGPRLSTSARASATRGRPTSASREVPQPGWKPADASGLRWTDNNSSNGSSQTSVRSVFKMACRGSGVRIPLACRLRSSRFGEDFFHI